MTRTVSSRVPLQTVNTLKYITLLDNLNLIGQITSQKLRNVNVKIDME